MTPHRNILLRGLLTAAVLAAPAVAHEGSGFTPGNVLICTENVVYEYTRQGGLVQSLDVPAGPGDTPARDIAVNRDGLLRVYKGTAEPYLSTLDPHAGLWRHETFAGWSTVSNGTYGGIAAHGRFSFVTDMRTSRAEEMGIVRFDDGGPPMRFAEDIDPIDLNMGIDGLLYALHPGGSPGGRQIDVYDPDTLIFIRRIFDRWSQPDHRSIAIDGEGYFYLADWDGDVSRFSPEGELQETVNLIPIADMRNLYDIDVAADGTLIVCDIRGRALVTDTAFTSFDFFDFNDKGGFVHIIADGCIADCDGSGALDLFDFLCYQSLFTAGNPEADCDGSGSLDVFDFLCFQTAFAVGC